MTRRLRTPPKPAPCGRSTDRPPLADLSLRIPARAGSAWDRQGESEVAAGVGPPMRHRQPGRGELAFDPLAAELGRDLGAQLLPGGEQNLQIKRGDRHHLLEPGAQPHLDPLLFGIPPPDAVEGVEIEVGPTRPAEHAEKL